MGVISCLERRIVIRCYLWTLAGGISLLLGVLGIFLPLLPTTPFILLASACFMRGSPRFHAWIQHHAIFGPLLRDWQQKRALPRAVKRKGATMIVLSFAFSIYWVSQVWLKFALLVFAIVLLLWFTRLPVVEPLAEREENH